MGGEPVEAVAGADVGAGEELKNNAPGRRPGIVRSGPWPRCGGRFFGFSAGESPL